MTEIVEGMTVVVHVRDKWRVGTVTAVKDGWYTVEGAAFEARRFKREDVYA